METNTHTCPVWVGRLMINPLRKLVHPPEKLFSDFIHSGMQILEIGPAMGYFTLPLARMIGQRGKVYAIDIQPEMLQNLNQRARKAGLSKRINTRTCTTDSLNIPDLDNQIDFCLLFAVVHEVGDQQELFHQVHQALKPGGCIYFAEPKGHVKPDAFEKSIDIAKRCGLLKISSLTVKGSHGAMLIKRLN